MTRSNKDTPLSGLDIKKLMSQMKERANIKLDSEILPNSTVQDIFNNSGHVILFHEWEGQDVGHWYCMVRQHEKNKNEYSQNGNVYFFDSFGEDPDKYQPNIKKVLSTKYDKLYVNNIPFQPVESSACGRYCLLVTALNKIGLNPHMIEQFMKSQDIDKFVINTIR